MLDMFQKGLLAAASVLTACTMSLTLATANATGSLCGGTFWGSGNFSSPGYPNNYPNNANCTWILNANATGYGILLQFTYFVTEPRYDVVRISDGRTQLSYNDSLWPYPVLMLDSRVVITFTSDSSNTYRGFSALFTTLSNVSCDGNVTGSGYIESKYYPLNYPHSKMCKWYLQADSSSTVIKLQFSSFNTEENYDIVTIYDERNKTYRYSGDRLPPILILGRLARVEFSTDNSVSKQGFRAAMTSVNIGSYSQCTAVGGYWCDRSYKCISRLWFCDRQTDCYYGEDEASCTTTSTTTTASPRSQCIWEGKFWCSTSSRCVPQSWRCDGASDCTYGEDEFGCTYTTASPESQCATESKFWCSNSRKCVSQSWRCDGTNDCAYGEDERGCSAESLCRAAGKFYCSRSMTCVFNNWKCDGTNDCVYGEDEDGCGLGSSAVGAIVGGVVGSIVGITVIIIIIVVACRAVSTRHVRTTVGARVVQHHTATATPTAVWSVHAGGSAQYIGGHAPQTQFAAPPSYEASARAYYAGWKISDQLPSSSGPATSAQPPAQAQGASA